MNEYKPKANKKLGQHYLNNSQTIKNICSDFPNQYDLIIEVGPGPATLTRELIKKEIPIMLIEKDERFIDVLNKLEPRPLILNTDALTFDITDTLTKFNSNSAWFVSNLPYNVGTPIMIKYLQISKIKYFTLMFQKEVAQKIYLPLFGEKKSAKEMNSLHALVNNYFKISMLQKVSPGQFSPPPKVDSVVLSFERKESPIIPLKDWKAYEDFLRKLFSNRRKQLFSVLKNYYEKNKIKKILEQLDVNTNARAETLGFEKVISLYELLRN